MEYPILHYALLVLVVLVCELITMYISEHYIFWSNPIAAAAGAVLYTWLLGLVIELVDWQRALLFMLLGIVLFVLGRTNTHLLDGASYDQPSIDDYFDLEEI